MPTPYDFSSGNTLANAMLLGTGGYGWATGNIPISPVGTAAITPTPTAAPATPQTPGAIQTSALQSNVGNEQYLTQLSDIINTINRNAQQQANVSRIPGEAGLEQQSSANIAQALGGRLPQDVIAQIGRGAAARGVASGSPWGDSNNAAYLQALGLNSLGMMGTGQDWLTGATARNPAAKIFDPTTMLMTPGEAGTLGLQQDYLGLQKDRLALERQQAAWREAIQALGSGLNAPAVPMSGYGSGWDRAAANAFAAMDRSRATPSTSPSTNWVDQWIDYMNKSGQSTTPANVKFPTTAPTEQDIMESIGWFGPGATTAQYPEAIGPEALLYGG